MAVADVWQIRVITQFGSQASFNVRHYLTTSQVGADIQPGVVANALDAIYAPLYKALMSSFSNYIGVEAQRIVPLPPGVPVQNSTRLGAGTVTGDPLPPQVAGLISLRTGFAGRPFRGRLYTPFPSETDSGSGGFPIATYVTRMQTLAAQLIASTQVASGGDSTVLTPIVFHRKTLTYTVILSALVRTVWATQRRRGLLGRPNPLT